MIKAGFSNDEWSSMWSEGVQVHGKYVELAVELMAHICNYIHVGTHTFPSCILKMLLWSVYTSAHTHTHMGIR